MENNKDVKHITVWNNDIFFLLFEAIWDGYEWGGGDVQFLYTNHI